jgi:hypothetical protein
MLITVTFSTPTGDCANYIKMSETATFKELQIPHFVRDDKSEKNDEVKKGDRPKRIFSRHRQLRPAALP